jgi:hypothetical protein
MRKRRKESVSPTEPGSASETQERDKSKENERSTSEGTYDLCYVCSSTPVPYYTITVVQIMTKSSLSPAEI